ncbi:hypothetical protein EMCRGX_G005753 [Ephydatia muelleri]
MSRNFAPGLLVVLVQIWSSAPQMCDYGNNLNQTQLSVTAVHVSVECYDTGNVGVSWSASPQQVNSLTLQYACTDPSVQGVLLQRSNEFNGQAMLPDGPFHRVTTCSVWGCFEWNNPVFMYPAVGIGNMSCTTLPLNYTEISSSLPSSYSQTHSPMNGSSAVASVPSNIISPTLDSSNAIPRLVVALAVVLTTCTSLATVSTALIAFFYCRRARLVPPPVPIDSSSIVQVDTMAAVDLQSINSDNTSFCPLDYSTTSTQSTSKVSGKDVAGIDPVMLYFEHPVCQQMNDECSSLGNVSYSGYIMVQAFHMDGYINSNVKAKGCHEPNHHETVLTENLYL